MRCVVTAGPTFEPLDKVRRLTNFSTGRLGCELANYLARCGHEVTLLLGEGVTWRGDICVSRLMTFTTTSTLRKLLRGLSSRDPQAVFHAAAVSDFRFAKLWQHTESGRLREVRAGKLSTRQGTLLAELVPTEKLIAGLRDWFPRARLVGWKFEVDGSRARLLKLARRQVEECRTDACVANGPAYGIGFGFVEAGGRPLHLRTRQALFKTLSTLLAQPGGAGAAG